MFMSVYLYWYVHMRMHVYLSVYNDVCACMYTYMYLCVGIYLFMKVCFRAYDTYIWGTKYTTRTALWEKKIFLTVSHMILWRRRYENLNIHVWKSIYLTTIRAYLTVFINRVRCIRSYINRFCRTMYVYECCFIINIPNKWFLILIPGLIITVMSSWAR